MTDATTAAVRGSGAPRARVAVVMGSDSDWPVMGGAVEVLRELGVAVEARVVSAHRMPADMLEFGRTAHEQGFEVIVAGAGGAAHLPGMLASMTVLPVVGVPVALSRLDGLDSLLSIVQMPTGVPVATVAVDNARNAGLLAARILAGSDAARGDATLRDQLVAFREAQRAKALAGDARVREQMRDLS